MSTVAAEDDGALEDEDDEDEADAEEEASAAAWTAISRLILRFSWWSDAQQHEEAGEGREHIQHTQHGKRAGYCRAQHVSDQVKTIRKQMNGVMNRLSDGSKDATVRALKGIFDVQFIQYGPHSGSLSEMIFLRLAPNFIAVVPGCVGGSFESSLWLSAPEFRNLGDDPVNRLDLLV